MDQDTGKEENNVEDKTVLKEEPSFREYSPQELKNLAIGLMAGTIFSSMSIKDNDVDLLGVIFMPIYFGLFAEQTFYEEIKDVGLIYEKMSNAGPRCVNGYPTFFSCELLHIKYFDDLQKVMEEIRVI